MYYTRHLRAQQHNEDDANKTEDEHFRSRNRTVLSEFKFEQIKTWQGFVNLLYQPTDAASLGVVRALFGLMMVLDIPEERGLSRADLRWGDTDECRFPLFNFLRPLPLQWMCILYMCMWLGAVGIMLGFMFRLSCLVYASIYWYIFLLDKSSWNNHSYLYGLLSILFLTSQAHHYCSLDCLFWPKKKTSVPLWNYAILRYQLFILYFIAGLKKLDLDWLSGYSMNHLSNHWVFEPFRYFLSPEQIDLYVIHLGGFFLDLTITFWLLLKETRVPALLFCSSFHLMNSQIFTIGMFPYVCLVTLPLFCNPDWPRKILHSLSIHKNNISPTKHMKENSNDKFSLTWRHSAVAFLLGTHVAAQAFLPYSHFLTQGYNNWTNGLYGYSWDMMVHTWNTILVMPKVIDKSTGNEHFLDPDAWVQNDRWSKHTDMVVQWAKCVERNLHATQGMSDISVHLDVWSSLNGRFQQRMYDPRVDLLQAEWSPFKRPSWVMPLMSQLSQWRSKIDAIEKHVFSWSNYTDVLFVADFSGLALENYITDDLGNVSLKVLAGEVKFEQDNTGHQVHLKTGECAPVLANAFHHVYTISTEPACYMYTYSNETAQQKKLPLPAPQSEDKGFLHHFHSRVNNFKIAVGLVWNALLHVIFGVPVPKRVRVG